MTQPSREDYEAQLVKDNAERLTAVMTLNADDPETVAAALNVIIEQFGTDAAQVLVSALMSATKLLHELLPTMDKFGQPLRQHLRAILEGEELPSWEFDIRELRGVVNGGRRTPSRAERKKGRRR